MEASFGADCPFFEASMISEFSDVVICSGRVSVDTCSEGVTIVGSAFDMFSLEASVFADDF